MIFDNNRVCKSSARDLEYSDKTDDESAYLIWIMMYTHKCEVKYHKIEAKVKKMELIGRIHLKVA